MYRTYYLITVAIWCFGAVLTSFMSAPWPVNGIPSVPVCGGLVMYNAITTCVSALFQAVIPITMVAGLYYKIAKVCTIKLFTYIFIYFMPGGRGLH